MTINHNDWVTSSDLITNQIIANINNSVDKDGNFFSAYQLKQGLMDIMFQIKINDYGYDNIIDQPKFSKDVSEWLSAFNQIILERFSTSEGKYVNRISFGHECTDECLPWLI